MAFEQLMAESLKKQDKKKDKDKDKHDLKKEKERQEHYPGANQDHDRPRWQTDPDSYDPSIPPHT